jgi:hypothetical protein
MLSQGIRRAPGMIQGAARGAMQGVMQAPSTMREALMQTQPQQGVAEILSQGLPEMMPDLGGATSAASRQRQIADMLLQGAQSQDNTSIAGGLSQLGQAFLARRAGQKADTAEDKQREMASLLMQQAMGQGPESQAARAQLFADNPAALIAQSDAAARQAVEDALMAEERTYERGRNTKTDEFNERAWITDQQRYETEQERAARLEAEDARRFDATYNLDLRGVKAAEAKAEAEANATPSVDFGDVKGVRETNEKRFQTFEESQRAYQSMSGLAELGTGAADIALGFAFFKTFDPNSTVREGEFAQAAGAMGLGDRAVSIFARLDKGEQFTPQLRKELVEAAGVAYNNQVADIEGLVQRESEFAGRYGINPSDITRNPVRAPANNKTTPPANVPPPPDGYDDSDVSWADAWAEMTPAERALFAPQSNTFPSRIKF